MSAANSIHAIARAQGATRSPKWRRVERAHLQIQGWCKNCGGVVALQVHHMMPFHLDLAKELDPANLITLCEDAKDGVECHLHVGHLGNWKTYNPAIAAVADSPRAGVPASHLMKAAA